MSIRVALLWLVLVISPVTKADEVFLDVIISNGNIIDGTGRAAYKADIGILDDIIVEVGDLTALKSRVRIDADGLVVSPGFIDLHSHTDSDLFKRPDATNNITQGVTTLLGGNCGGSPVDMNEFLKQLDNTDISLNMGMLVGHNSVRRAVMQRANRHATDKELQQMQSLVAEAMKAGAFGLSSGLIYIPGTFSPPEETQALAKVAHEHNGFYATHMRSEGKQVVAAVEEALDLAKATGIPVHISHHKAAGPEAWGLSEKTLMLIESSREAGMRITLDQYPYTASNTNLGVLMPSWSLAGGHEQFLQRLADDAMRQSIKQEVVDIIKSQRAGTEFWRIMVSSYQADPALEGKNFEQIMVSRGMELTLENAAELAIELQRTGGGRGIYHTMQDEDVERIMQYPHTAVASDGRGVAWQSGNPHPRNYGTYPRTLARYVREKGVLTLPEAVKKMTSMPAQIMGLTDRGVVEVGYKADLAIWDPETIQDNSTFSDPHQYSTGMKYVLVNGELVLANGEMTGRRPGIALRSH